ncbi:MAG TPA: glycosyltransferase family 39 protein, partial [Candidatus Methylomirabilis sp.]|nr:glycosyltransferase family 39 protein [Candidatus Methylomirabilis sp.]
MLLTLLFLASVLALSPGIGEVTGITTGDESQLTFRTALTMMEHDVWIVPRLGENPRLKKPPMIYWLTRASFEVFGVSLLSGRIPGVLFGALLVLVVALIGFEFTDNLKYSLCAGLIALSTIGVTIESRYAMLDVPTAAFSGLAFYWFLKWCRSKRVWLLAGVAMCLAAGFLTKFFVVFIIFGAGVLALCIADAEIRSVIWRGKGALAGSLLLFLGLTAPWFLHVYVLYRDYFVQTFMGETVSRLSGSLSPIPLIALPVMAFPWSFIFMYLLIRPESFPSKLFRIGSWKLLVLWVGLSLLPFFFIGSYGRYVIGSLVPIALLCAATMEPGNERRVQIHARLAMIVASVTVLSFAALSWWFRTSMGGLIAVLAAYGVFALVWWQSTDLIPMASSAALLWMTLAGILYPTLGFNAIPARILEAVKGRPVILFKDKQPRFLYMQLGRTVTQRDVLGVSDVSSEGGQRPVIFTSEEYLADLEHNLRALGVEFRQADSYKTL